MSPQVPRHLVVLPSTKWETRYEAGTHVREVREEWVGVQDLVEQELDDHTLASRESGVPRRRDTRVYECSCLVPARTLVGDKLQC